MLHRGLVYRQEGRSPLQARPGKPANASQLIGALWPPSLLRQGQAKPFGHHQEPRSDTHTHTTRPAPRIMPRRSGLWTKPRHWTLDPLRCSGHPPLPPLQSLRKGSSYSRRQVDRLTVCKHVSRKINDAQLESTETGNPPAFYPAPAWQRPLIPRLPPPHHGAPATRPFCSGRQVLWEASA